nr:MAG TPA: hypothetical protein [Caudoviricetes sp.]
MAGLFQILKCVMRFPPGASTRRAHFNKSKRGFI